MSTRKFFALMLLMAFALFAVTGCGGGGGGSSNSGGDTPETPTTPTNPTNPGNNGGGISDTQATAMGLQRLNEDNKNFRIAFAEDGTVSEIDGKLSTKTVQNETGALAVVDELKNLVGISTNAPNELTAVNSTSDAYQFAQKASDGTIYYGRGVTLLVNSSGNADALSSNFWTGDPATVTSAADISKEQAEEAAVKYYTSAIFPPELNEDIDTKLVIYSLGDYESNPVRAYIVNVRGFREATSEELADGANNNEGMFFSDAVFVNAQTGAVITTITNLHGDMESTSARDELGNTREFSVDHDGARYYMRNQAEYNLRILTSSGTIVDANALTGPWGLQNGESVGQEVSLYANAMEVLKWYKDTFGRDSVDGNGGKTKPVQIVAHYPGWPNNAAWETGANKIYFGNRSGSTSIYAHSMAVDIDTVTHEINHGMLEASIGVAFPWTGVTAAINQGYADLFGCLKERKWLHGQYWLNQSGPYNSIRNIANPTDPKAFNRVSSGAITADNPNVRAYVQIWGVLVSHAAYLMQTNGISWEDLEQLWYKSMSMGYNASSTMQTVRTCVMRAGRKLGFSEDKLQIIRDAFDEEHIYDSQAAVYGKVTDYSTGEAIQGATVTAKRGSKTYSKATDTDGNYELIADLGAYTVDVSATGYVSFSTSKALSEASKDVMLNASLIKSGRGTITGYIINASDDNAIPGVTLEVISGWDNEDGSAVQTLTTDNAGQYTLTANAGYYTIKMSKSGYATSSFNATIAPENNKQQNGYMSATDIFVNNGQRIVLSWGENPTDLDAHLLGKLSDGTEFHVYYLYGNREAKDSSGATVATLDVDNRNGNGHETITLNGIDTKGKYDFIVRWRGGSGSWAGSNAVAVLYVDANTKYEFRPEALTDYVEVGAGGRVTTPSTGYTTYWHVFTIDNGRLIETGKMYKINEAPVAELGTSSIE